MTDSVEKIARRALQEIAKSRHCNPTAGMLIGEAKAALALMDEAANATSQEAGALTFDAWRMANVARCLKWHPTGIESWSPSDWMTAVTGELGELASLLKMRNRERDGLPGNKFSPTQKQIADEIADVFAYLDLLAACLGVNLGKAAVSKFNEVSERVGFPDRIPVAPPPQPVSETAAQGSVEFGEALDELIRANTAADADDRFGVERERRARANVERLYGLASAGVRQSVSREALRTKFHAWARGMHIERDLWSDPQGVYLNGAVQMRWNAWCAAIHALDIEVQP